MNDFFSALRDKIKTQPDRASDQRFWARFEVEFGAPEKKRRFWSPAKLSSTFASLVIFVLLCWKVFDQSAKSFDEQQMAAQILLQQDFLEHMETMSELDGGELDDEEWELLLSGEESRDS